MISAKATWVLAVESLFDVRAAGGAVPGRQRSAWGVALCVLLGMSILPISTLALTPIPHASRRPALAAPIAAAPAAGTAGAGQAARPISPPPAVSAATHADEAAVCAGVCGAVVDPDGKPVAGAQVVCKRNGASFASITSIAGADGRWSLDAEAAGCRAYARKEGFADSDVVTLEADRDNVLRFAPPAAIEGYVVDPSGAPVPSFWVSIEAFTPANGESMPPSTGRAHAVTAPDGRFVLPDLLAGRYVVAAKADGFTVGRSRAVDVDRGLPTSRVRILLSPGATLTGSVTAAETGEPLSGATVAVELVATLGPRPPPATTDASGAFTLTGVPTEAFSVSVRHDGYRTKIVGGLDVVHGPRSSAPFALTPVGDDGAKLEVIGVGIGLLRTPKGMIVASLAGRSPAEKAGVHGGDLLQRIDGVSTADLTWSECIQRLEGPERSRVSVQVARDGHVQDLVLTRELSVQ